MAEFCLKCFNELYQTDYKRRHVVLDYDFCEGCGVWKKCVVKIRHDRTSRALKNPIQFA